MPGVGLLEAADAPAVGAGEGAALVAEELGLQQLRGDRGACSARRTASWPAGCAGAARGPPAPCRSRIRPVISTFMLERDSRPMVRNTSCIAGAWPIICGMTEPWRPGRWPALAARARRTPDQRHRFVDVEGLRQVLERAAAISGNRAVEVGVRGDDDHRQATVRSPRCAASAPARRIPGMRTSVMTTSGLLGPSAPRRTARPARRSGWSCPPPATPCRAPSARPHRRPRPRRSAAARSRRLPRRRRSGSSGRRSMKTVWPGP